VYNVKFEILTFEENTKKMVQRTRQTGIVQSFPPPQMSWSLLYSPVLQDRDRQQTGKISYDQLEDIFRIYQVRVRVVVQWWILLTCCQVDLDERAAAKITDDEGDISKEDFVKIAQDQKLLDFGNIMGGDGMKQGSAKKQSRTYNNNNAANGFQGGKVPISYFRYFAYFGFLSPAFSAVVGWRRKKSRQSWWRDWTGWRQLSGSLTWMGTGLSAGMSSDR
jgi:hypothetical protein